MRDNEKSAVLALHDAVTKWIPKRKETVKNMERVADEINRFSKITNGVKIGGSVAGVAAGIVAIVMTGGSSLPIIAGMGVAGVLASEGAEVNKKVQLSKWIEELKEKIYEETDQYQTLIYKLRELKDKIGERYNGYVYWKGSSSGTGILNAEKVTSSDTCFTITDSVNVVKTVASSTAKVASSTAKVAGKATGRVFVKHTVGAARKVVVVAGKATGRVFVKHTARKVVVVAGPRTARRSGARIVPLLNIGFAVWDAYEAVKAGREISTGSETECNIRANVEELKNEANNIVMFFNCFAEKLEMSKIKIPF